MVPEAPDVVGNQRSEREPDQQFFQCMNERIETLKGGTDFSQCRLCFSENQPKFSKPPTECRSHGVHLRTLLALIKSEHPKKQCHRFITNAREK